MRFLQVQGLARKTGQDKASRVNVAVIIAAETVLLCARPRTQRHAQVALGILAADHEPDLAGRIGGDGRVGVFCDREDLLAGFLELRDERQMEPLVLG